MPACSNVGFWSEQPCQAYLRYLRQAEGLLFLPASPERTKSGPEWGQTEMGSDVSYCLKLDSSTAV